MKNILKFAVTVAVAFYFLGAREMVVEVFGNNVGLDGVSRAVEVAVQNNPAAAFVFNIQPGEVQVFADGCYD